MRTQLVFFDGTNASAKGTLRGTVASGIILLLILFLNRKVFKTVKWYWIIISTVLLASALSVQLPGSMQEAAVYGALVGAVVYGFGSMMFTNSSSLGDVLTKLLFGIIIGSVTSSVLYQMFWR